MSSAVPTRPTGMRAAHCSWSGRFPSSCCSRAMGVSIDDGGMVFTVIPIGANSRASARIKPITPPFDDT